MSDTIDTEILEEEFIIDSSIEEKTTITEPVIEEEEPEIKLTYDNIYPVGSIYMTTLEGASPAALFGGTWIQIENRFLLGSGDRFVAGDKGGEEQVYLNINQMPLHQHMNRNPIKSEVKVSTNEVETDYQWEVQVSDWGAIETSYAGGNEAHNNMPPYFVVCIWQRIE